MSSDVHYYYFCDKMKNKKYHTVRTVQRSNRRTKHTTLLGQFKGQIEEKKIPHC